MNNKNESMAAFFHNQKKGDFNPKTGAVFMPGSKEYKKLNNYEEKQKVDKVTGDSNDIEKHISQLISDIDGVKPDKNYQNDPAQINLLKEKKQTTKELILILLDDVKEYINIIGNIDEIKQNKDNDEYLNDLEKAGELRVKKHNALMSSADIVNRFIANNFGKIDDEIIYEWEENEKENNRPVLYAERIGLPSNIIYTDSMDTTDRKKITEWAIRLVETMTNIKKRLS